ncbi:MAG: hypothetical protein AAGF12_04370 [Myxococcota bacterium]
MRSHACLAFAVLLGGCATDGILEVEVDAPPADVGLGVNFMQVQVRPAVAEFPFADDWRSPDDLDAIRLGAARAVYPISVISDQEGDNIRVKVTLCDTAACSELGDEYGQVRYDIEAPFYVGERTRVRVEIPDLAMIDVAAPVMREIERCAVEGCVAGELGSGYCRLDSQRHLCE